MEKVGSVLHLDGWLAFVHGRRKGGWEAFQCKAHHPPWAQAGNLFSRGRMEIKLVRVK